MRRSHALPARAQLRLAARGLRCTPAVQGAACGYSHSPVPFIFQKQCRTYNLTGFLGWAFLCWPMIRNLNQIVHGTLHWSRVLIRQGRAEDGSLHKELNRDGPQNPNTDYWDVNTLVLINKYTVIPKLMLAGEPLPPSSPCAFANAFAPRTSKASAPCCTPQPPQLRGENLCPFVAHLMLTDAHGSTA